MEDSLRQALEVWESLPISYPDFELDEMEIFLLELILQIIVAVQSKNSTLLSTMLPESLKDDRIWRLFKRVFSYMLDVKQFWEAHRILQSLLEVIPLDEAKSLIREYFSKVHQLETQSNEVKVALASTIEAVHRDFVDRGICDISKEDHQCLLIELSNGKVSANKYCYNDLERLAEGGPTWEESSGDQYYRGRVTIPPKTNVKFNSDNTIPIL